MQAASMRPAHCAREVGLPVLEEAEDRGASMRPAHCAREVGVLLHQVLVPAAASMRPAHCAREVERDAPMPSFPDALQ